MEGSAEAEGGRGIRFGTNGWRGILGDEFTFPRLRAVVRATGAWVAKRDHGRVVVVAHDRRFLGERLAAEAAAILGEGGAEVLVAAGAVPTPVAAHAVRRHGAAAALIVTASHNAPEYQGVKVLGPWGGAIGRADAQRIEELTDEVSDAPPDVATPPADVDLVGPYCEGLTELLDLERLRGAGLRVVYDAMHGTGAGVLDRVLEGAGVHVRVRRAEPDACFGGVAPDPAPERIGELARIVGDMRGLRLGLATDGDADRFAVVDSDGAILSETESVALLVDHLARTRTLPRGIAVSTATGSLVERVAESHGIAVQRHPVGFSHLALALAAGGADAAGEESGGFAFAPFAHDKDGMLAGCLLAELMASTRAPLRQRLDELEARHGRRHCRRIAIPAPLGARDTLAALAERPPCEIDGCAVQQTDVAEGLRLELEDGFLMLRASGTEPVLRVYAEAAGPRRLERRLAAGARLLGGDG